MLIHILIHILIHVLISYTHAHIYSRILIHVYSFINTHSRIHFINSCAYSFTYTHSCILIHIYSSIYSFRIFLSFVIIFWLYVIIIIYHLTTLCVHEHIYTFFIFYIFLVSCLIHMTLHILVKYDVYEITPHSYILIPL